MDKKSFLLQISGSIGPSKHREFEQTVRFVFNMLPGSCYSSHLTLDVFHPHLYHLITLWNSAEDMMKFRNGEECELIKSSFRTLGYIDRTFAANLIDEHSFEISE